jgi:caa(3)-type oxidase subunit IV
MAGSVSHVEHSPAQYIKIWAILLVLLVISICGPLLGIRAVTLITAFGIAIVKALLVAANFMHLNIERRYIWYLLITMLLIIGLFVAGTSPDVMQAQGHRWINKSKQQLIQQHEAQ